MTVANLINPSVADYDLVINGEQASILRTAALIEADLASGRIADAILRHPQLEGVFPAGSHQRLRITEALKEVEARIGLEGGPVAHRVEAALNLAESLLTDKDHGLLELAMFISEQQAIHMVEMLDRYSRIGLGQLHTMLEQGDLFAAIWKRPDGATLRDDLESTMLDVVKPLTHPSMGSRQASFGIYSIDIHESNRVAWDLQRVIRHRVSWDRMGNPPARTAEMFGVNYDVPGHSSPSVPMAVIFRRTPVQVPAAPAEPTASPRAAF